MINMYSSANNSSGQRERRCEFFRYMGEKKATLAQSSTKSAV